MGDEMFLILMVVVVTGIHLSKLVKLCIQNGCFIEYKLYLNKVDLNFKIFMNNAYMNTPEYIEDSLNYLIVISV